MSSIFEPCPEKNNKPATGEQVNNYKFVQVLLTAKVRSGGERVLGEHPGAPRCHPHPCHCSHAQQPPPGLLCPSPGVCCPKSRAESTGSDCVPPFPWRTNSMACEINSPRGGAACQRTPALHQQPAETQSRGTQRGLHPQEQLLGVASPWEVPQYGHLVAGDV